MVAWVRHHKNGTETYVFQPRFCDTAQQFGLILLVPAKLSAQPALSKAEVFTYLTSISQPTIAYSTVCARGGVAGGLGGSSGGGGDAASVTPTSPDASSANQDAGTSTPVEPPAKKHSGCSFSASSARGNFLSAFVVALLVGILRRRR